MSRFMANVAIDGVRLVFQGINNIGEQHHEMPAKKLCGQGVKEVCAQQVGLGTSMQQVSEV